MLFTQGTHKEEVKTNGAGIARWRDVDGGSFARAKLANPKELREALRERWGKSKAAEGLEGQVVSVLAEEIASSLTREEPATLILYAPLERVRLIGMHFDTNKSFLRRTAMKGIRGVSEAPDRRAVDRRPHRHCRRRTVQPRSLARTRGGHQGVPAR